MQSIARYPTEQSYRVALAVSIDEAIFHFISFAKKAEAFLKSLSPYALVPAKVGISSSGPFPSLFPFEFRLVRPIYYP